MKPRARRPDARAGFRAAILVGLLMLCAAPALAWIIWPEESGPFKLTVLREDLDSPWGLAFLPDGQMLVTLKGGGMALLGADGADRIEIAGLPGNIIARGQGGLLDVIIDHGFTQNRLVYFSYSGGDAMFSGTEVARAELNGAKLENLKTIFVARPKVRRNAHYGSRLLIAPDGTLFVTLGERQDMKQAQNLRSHHGKIVRINRDGSVPADNPFVGDKDALPEIYSYGHRNVQGIALQPGTGLIWAHEHGPRGGDEVNIIEAGVNYGWPEITYGVDYDGSTISKKTAAPGMRQPVAAWSPSPAPSGMTFYQGSRFPEWQGDLFIGALAGQHLRHALVEGRKITKTLRYLDDSSERIRDVRTGPDGFLYILTDGPRGRLVRLEPRSGR